MGMAEAVIVKLGQQPALRVPSIGAVRRYAGPEPNPLQAGRELGVDTVLDGSLLRADGRLRVSARLLDVAYRNGALGAAVGHSVDGRLHGAGRDGGGGDARAGADAGRRRAGQPEAADERRRLRAAICARATS